MKERFVIILTAFLYSYILIQVFCSNTSTIESENTGWSEMGLKGKVKFFSELYYSLDKKDISKAGGLPKHVHLISFNDKGNIIYEQFLKQKRIMSWYKYIEYKYDDKGNMVEEAIYDVVRQNITLSVKLTYEYDIKGNVIEENFYLANGSLDYKVVYKYNEKGNRIEAIIYRYGDDPVYNKYLKLFQLEDNRCESWTYKYDNKGNMIEENSYLIDGSLINWSIYKYDKKGNMVEENSYYIDGSLTSRSTYKYDEKRNRIEKSVYNPDDSLFEKWTYEYEFDDIGNWIKRNDFKNDKLKNISRRQLIYY